MRIRSQCLTSSPPPSLQAEFKEAQAAAGSATSVPGGGADGGGPAAAAAAAAAPVEGPRPQVAFNRALVPAGAVVAAAQAGCPEGAVLAAAQDNDVPALEALRKAGGSAEEADEVRGEGSGVGFGGGKSVQDSLPPPPLNPSSAGRPHCLLVGHLLRPPRGPPLAPGGRRQPGRSQQGEERKGAKEWRLLGTLGKVSGTRHALPS